MNFISGTILTLMLTLTFAGWIFYYLERSWPIKKNQLFYRKEFFVDLLFALINSTLVTPLVLIIAWYCFIQPAKASLYPHQLFTHQISSLSLILQILVNLLLMDFVTYWRHRITHKWMWQLHAVHHSAEEIDWLTRHRVHPGDAFIATVAAFAMSHIVGFGELGVGAAIIIYTIGDYINHANLKFGFKSWLRYVFVTPQFHRWHHAADKPAIDKNFAAMFSFYDFIFGSYYCPAGEFPTHYGLVEGAQKNFPAAIQLQLLYPFRHIILAFKRAIAHK